MFQTAAEDELDLLSFWAALVRWRYLVAALTLAGLMAGVAFKAMTPRLYESRAVLQIGRIGGLGRIQPPAELVQQLKHGAAPSSSASAGQLATVEEIAEGIIALGAVAPTPDESRAFLKNQLDSILNEHNGRFNEAKAFKSRARDSVVARINAIEEQAQEVAKRIDIIGRRDPSLGAMLTEDRTRLAAELSQLDERLSVIDLELSRISTSPTVVLQHPTAPVPLDKKGTWFYAAIGAAVGLVFGMGAAVLLGAAPLRRSDVR